MLHLSLTGIGVLLAKGLLLLASVISVAIMIDRALWLSRIARREEEDFAALSNAVSQIDAESIRRHLKDSAAPSVRALNAGLASLKSGEDHARAGINQGVVVECAHLQRRLPTLGTIASTAPYIGLFGTVVGILAAFHDIALTGRTGAAVVSGAISDALVTTALGLGVAIPAVVAYNYFVQRVNDLSLVVETHALELAARLSELIMACEGSQ